MEPDFKAHLPRPFRRCQCSLFISSGLVSRKFVVASHCAPYCRYARVQDVPIVQAVQSPSFVLPRVAREERGGGQSRSKFQKFVSIGPLLKSTWFVFVRARSRVRAAATDTARAQATAAPSC